MQETESVSEKFQKAFSLFRHCHSIYDSKSISIDDINTIGRLIHNINITLHFVLSQRRASKCSWSSIKQHSHRLQCFLILEDHVVPWLKEWRVGFGLMGEQGAESIHVYFNSLARTYHSIPQRVDHLRAMMREHSLHSTPTLATERPLVKRRKDNSREE